FAIKSAKILIASFVVNITCESRIEARSWNQISNNVLSRPAKKHADRLSGAVCMAKQRDPDTNSKPYKTRKQNTRPAKWQAPIVQNGMLVIFFKIG
ncbi:hypothetical protein LJC56_03050, partial [Christensenellaceae bacterium OttesenSCG-928-K19]|nr:hypothetical protein [Christensenellaceae bacterium OttesenSCG-928-K19]